MPTGSILQVLRLIVGGVGMSDVDCNTSVVNVWDEAPSLCIERRERKIVTDNTGTPKGLSLAGGASSVSTVMSCNARVTLPRFGRGSIVIYNAQRSTAGGARFRAEKGLHRLAPGSYVHVSTGELLELNRGDVLPALDEYRPYGADSVWVSTADDVVQARPDPIRNARASKKKLLNYALNNPWSLFMTMTFAREKVQARRHTDRFDVGIIKAVRVWLNNRRRVYGAFEYLLVPELHKNGAIHIHMLLMGLPESQLVPATYPDGRRRVDAGGRIQWRWVDASVTWGFTDGSKVSDVAAVSQYVSKYISKSFDAQRAWDTELGASAPAQYLPGVSVSGLGSQRFYVSRGVESAPVFVADGMTVELDDTWYVINTDGSRGMGVSRVPGVHMMAAVKFGGLEDDWVRALLDQMLDSRVLDE